MQYKDRISNTRPPRQQTASLAEKAMHQHHCNAKPPEPCNGSPKRPTRIHTPTHGHTRAAQRYICCMAVHCARRGLLQPPDSLLTYSVGLVCLYHGCDRCFRGCLCHQSQLGEAGSTGANEAQSRHTTSVTQFGTAASHDNHTTPHPSKHFCTILPAAKNIGAWAGLYDRNHTPNHPPTRTCKHPRHRLC